MNSARRPAFALPIAFALALALLVLVATPTARAQSETPGAPPPPTPATAPGVLVILVDDLGWADIGCQGAGFYETPNIDRLAREGARFTDAYSSCPVCSPTRAALMTGLWPQRFGATDYFGAVKRPEEWPRNTILRPAPYDDRLPLDAPTLAKAFKAAGRPTFFAGKWHLGPEGHWPEDQGFDFNLGGHASGGPYGGDKYFSPYGNPRLPDGPPGEHLPDRLAAETVKFLENHARQPFLAYLAFYSVHTPLIARPDLKQKYERKRAELGLQTRWGREGVREIRLTRDHPVYAAMVEAMDLAVGRVLDALDRLGIAESTIVLFTSDNGGLSNAEGWPTSNQPLRAGKGWLYEGGVRVPFIVRWPGRVAPGRVVREPVSSVDVLPTLLAAADVPPEPGRRFDGADLAPLLLGNVDALPERTLFWHYPHYGNNGGAPAAAARRGDWKLLQWHEDDSLELYNLRDDPGETRDLAEQRPDILRFLHAELRGWLAGVGARFPLPNPEYDPAKPSGRAAPRPPVVP